MEGSAIDPPGRAGFKLDRLRLELIDPGRPFRRDDPCIPHPVMPLRASPEKALQALSAHTLPLSSGFSREESFVITIFRGLSYDVAIENRDDWPERRSALRSDRARRGETLAPVHRERQD